MRLFSSLSTLSSMLVIFAFLGMVGNIAGLLSGCKVEPEAKPAEVTEPAAPVEVPSVQVEPVQSEAPVAPSSATGNLEQPVPVTMAQTGQSVEVAATPTP